MFDLEFNADRGFCLLAGEPLILHCNHYNTYLQRTILDPEYIDARPLLQSCASAAVFAQAKELFAKASANDLAQRLGVAENLFQFLGFGLLDFSAVTADGGLVSGPSSHYSYAWNNKFGQSDEPVAFFDAGFISGILGAAINAEADYFKAQQIACIAQGAPTNQFQVSVDKTPVIASPGIGIKQKGDIPPISIPSNINEPGIVSALASMPIAGNDQGLIPAFGVVLTRMYANYYNGISFGFEKLLEQAVGDETLGAVLLVEAGHSCAFNTFGGIMESDEWAGLVKPMCKTREDWVHGIVAVVNALGWGIWRIQELVPNERLVIRVYDGYESNGYLALYGQSKSPKSYLATGGTQGIMNLLYHIDITEGPALTPELYETWFSAPGSFTGRQTKCRAMGDDFDEFVAERD